MERDDSTIEISVTADFEISAVFIRQYELSFSIEGLGSLDGIAGLYDEGTTLNLTATPVEGWVFDGWEGSIQGNTNPLLLLFDADYDVVAVFVPLYPID